jgi:hypothetical protein
VNFREALRIGRRRDSSCCVITDERVPDVCLAFASVLRMCAASVAIISGEGQRHRRPVPFFGKAPHPRASVSRLNWAKARMAINLRADRVGTVRTDMARCPPSRNRAASEIGDTCLRAFRWRAFNFGRMPVRLMCLELYGPEERALLKVGPGIGTVLITRSVRKAVAQKHPTRER